MAIDFKPDTTVDFIPDTNIKSTANNSLNELRKEIRGAVLSPISRAPQIGQMIGGFAGVPTFNPLAGAGVSALGGILGRFGGETVKAESDINPIRTALKMVSPVAPGIENVAVSPDRISRLDAFNKRKEALENTAKEIPTEVLSGLATFGIGKIGQIRKMGKYYDYDRAKQFWKDTTDLKDLYGNEIRNITDNLKPDKVIPTGKIVKELKKLPDKMLTEIKNNYDTFGVRFLPNGTPLPTLKNIQALKEAVGDFISDVNWLSSVQGRQSTVKGVYSKIRDIMVDIKPMLKEPLNAYHRFMEDVFIPIKQTVQPKRLRGNISEKGLGRMISPTSDAIGRKAVEAVESSSDSARRAIRDIKKFQKRETLKQMIPGIARNVGTKTIIYR